MQFYQIVTCPMRFDVYIYEFAGGLERDCVSVEIRGHRGAVFAAGELENAQVTNDKMQGINKGGQRVYSSRGEIQESEYYVKS